jgi:hypothetical protein
VTVAQVQVLMRGMDPIYEIGLALFGHRMEDRMWQQTLRTLATHFGATSRDVEQRHVCVDRHRQWRQWRNIRYNAVIHTTLHALTAPGRWIVKAVRRPGD